MMYPHLPHQPSIAKTCLWHVKSHLYAEVNFRQIITYRWKHSIWKTLQPQPANTLCVIRYGTNFKSVLIEHDFIDRWCLTDLIKDYVYIYFFYSNRIVKTFIKKPSGEVYIICYFKIMTQFLDNNAAHTVICEGWHFTQMWKSHDCIILLRGHVWSHKISETRPIFIVVHVSSQESER